MVRSKGGYEMRGYEGNLEGDRMGEGLPSVASQGGRAICGDATKGGTWNLEAKGAIGTRLGPQEGGRYPERGGIPYSD